MKIVNCTASDNTLQKTGVQTFQASFTTRTLVAIAGRKKMAKGKEPKEKKKKNKNGCCPY